MSSDSACSVAITTPWLGAWSTARAVIISDAAGTAQRHGSEIEAATAASSQNCPCHGSPGVRCGSANTAVSVSTSPAAVSTRPGQVKRPPVTARLDDHRPTRARVTSAGNSQAAAPPLAR